MFNIAVTDKENSSQREEILGKKRGRKKKAKKMNTMNAVGEGQGEGQR